MTYKGIAAGLTVAGLGSLVLLGAPGASAEVSCNNGRVVRSTCHPIGPPNPGVCQPDPGGSPDQLAYFWMCDEYGFRSKLALDKIVVSDPVAAVKVGYAICAEMPPPDSDDPWAGTPVEQAAETMVLSSGVVATGDVGQFMTDAIMWLC